MAEQPTLPSNPRVAVTELEALHHAAYSWALTRCGHRRADAADLLQAAYARLLDGSAQFDGRSAFKTFVFGVIDRIAREERRRERIRSVLRGQFSAAFSPSEIDQPANITPNSDTDRVRAALRALSARQRDVLELVFYRDCTIEEAAAIIGISVGTARTHYERGKRAMTDALGSRARSAEISND